MKRWLLVFFMGAMFTLAVGIFIDFRQMLDWIVDRASYVALILFFFFLLVSYVFLKRRKVEEVVADHMRQRIDYYTEPMFTALAQSSQQRPADAMHAWAEFSARVFNLIQLRFFIVLGLTLMAGIVGTVSIALMNQQNTLLARRWVSEGRPAALEALYKTERTCREQASGKVICDDRPIANFRARLEALETYIRIQRAEGRRANLSGLNMKDGLIVDMQLPETLLTKASFQRSSVEDCIFDNAKLTFADFRDTVLRDVSFENANLRGAKFDGASFEGLSFKNAKIAGASFRNVTHTVNGEKVKLSCQVLMVAKDWAEAKGIDHCPKPEEPDGTAEAN